VADPKLGVKRVCPKCENKFYDLMRNPAICPNCGNEFDPLALLRPQRSRKAEASKPEPKPNGSLDVIGSDLEVDNVDEADEIEALEHIDEVEIEVTEDSDEDDAFEDSDDLDVADNVIDVIDESPENKDI